MEESNDGQYPVPPDIEALLSLVKSSAIKKAANRVPQALWELSVDELEARLKPSDAARLIRAAFWEEVGGAMALRDRVKVPRVARGAGLSYDRAHEIFTDDPATLVWILQPLRNGYADIETSMCEALDRVREVLDLPLTDRRGRPSVRNAKLIFGAFEALASHQKITNR